MLTRVSHEKLMEVDTVEIPGKLFLIKYFMNRKRQKNYKNYIIIIIIVIYFQFFWDIKYIMELLD